MNQLDRIELKLNYIIELLLIEPHFIAAVGAKTLQPWKKTSKLQKQTVKKIQELWIDENSNNTASKPD
jgi:hypothetical protein